MVATGQSVYGRCCSLVLALPIGDHPSWSSGSIPPHSRHQKEEDRGTVWEGSEGPGSQRVSEYPWLFARAPSGLDRHAQ